jgi:hypothetical protein
MLICDICTLIGAPDQQNIRRFIIGLDYNFVKLLPEGGNVSLSK